MAGKESVVSSVGNSGSVCVQLHPLVIMNVSDHYTRIRAQADGGNPQGSISALLIFINLPTVVLLLFYITSYFTVYFLHLR